MTDSRSGDPFGHPEPRPPAEARRAAEIPELPLGHQADLAAGPGGPGPARRVGGPVGIAVAWCVIAAMVAVSLALHALSVDAVDAEGPPSDDPVTASMLGLQSRYVVGAAHSAMLGGAGGATLADQLMVQFPGGPPRIRLRKAIVLAELIGPAAGLEELDRLDAALAAADQPLEADDEVLAQALRRHLESISADPDAVIPDADREELVAALDWFGELAAVLSSTESAREPVLAKARFTFFGMIGGVIGGGAATVAGLVILICAIVAVASGRLRSARPDTRNTHPVMAETFAVWIVVFLGLQIVVGLIGAMILGPDASATGSMLLAFAAFAASLVVLAWPVLRGVRWSEAAAAIGLHRGRGFVREVAAGFIAWLAALPILGVGVMTTLLLMVLSGVLGGDASMVADDSLEPMGGPAHPIVAELGGSLWTYLSILLVGAVAAPVVEETFFRGVLYGHLRGATRGLPAGLSIALAAVASAFVFAVIHPQGWVAIPALGSLAVAFALAREWRGSLIAPMVMHAINNGLVLGGLGLLMG